VTTNSQIARRLDELANLLEAQRANPFRVNAYRRGALVISGLPEPVSEMYQREGVEGLEQLPHVGHTLAIAVRTMVETGRLPLLEHLRGEIDPVLLFESVPGIGRIQAERLHHELGIDTLEDLEAAAHDGRLASIAGFGSKKVAGIIDSLASRLGRVRRPEGGSVGDVPVEELLDVDREYREGVRAGTLPTIAPRRFNPESKAWLPILHTQRGDRHYAAMFSNTARAHRLGTTLDWVILYQDGASGAHQCTVVTSRQGPLEGYRIVRGREAECREFFERQGGGLAIPDQAHGRAQL
jgi:DNA polymerase (family 10)